MPTPRRSTHDLVNEFRATGFVQIEGIPYTVAIASLLTLIISAMIAAQGLVSLVLAAFGVGRDLGWLGAIFISIGTLGLLLGRWLHQRRQRVPGPWWQVSHEGITIDGVGPVPWEDMAAPRRQLEPAIRGTGYQPAHSIPLTQVGINRARMIPPELRPVLNPGLRKTILRGMPDVTSIIPTMKELSAGDFADFVGEVQRWGTPLRPL